MKIDPLNNAKKKKFVEAISYLGVGKIGELLIKTGKERIRAFSGSLSVEEIWDFWRLFPVEGIGLYLGKEMITKNGERKVRLSLDGLHLLKDQISGNIVDLEEEQVGEWFRGKDIDLTEEQTRKYKDYEGFVAVRFGEDFLGTGNISQDGKRLFGFLPKERRIRD